MSLKFLPIQVYDVVQETPDAVTLTFAIEKADAGAYRFLAGQYLTLKLDIDGQTYRRSYSICTSPVADSELAVTIKAVEKGTVSTWLKENARKGLALQTLPPLGSFVLEPNASLARHHVFIGAGSGITPLFSMLKTALAAEPHSTVSLLYGSRDQLHIIYRSQLAALEDRYGSRLRVLHCLSQPMEGWPGATGRLDASTLPDLLRTALTEGPGAALPPHFYLCGPEDMMRTAIELLEAQGYGHDRISREYYSAPAPDADAPEVPVILNDTQDIYTIQVLLDGAEHTLTIPAGKTILQAVLDAGLDPPYACEEGVCASCRARVLAGEVQAVVLDGLSDEELSAGFTLTCQAVPLSDGVKISYE